MSDADVHARVQALVAELQANPSESLQFVTGGGAALLAKYNVSAADVFAFYDDPVVKLFTDLQTDPALRQRFSIATLPTILQERGISAAQVEEYISRHGGRDVTVDVRFWGLSITLSHDRVNALVADDDSSVKALKTTITDILSAPTGQIGAAIEYWVKKAVDTVASLTDKLPDLLGEAMALAFAAKRFEFQKMDEWGGNKGVWLPITWIQLPLLLNVGTTVEFIHPLPNW